MSLNNVLRLKIRCRCRCICRHHCSGFIHVIFVSYHFKVILHHPRCRMFYAWTPTLRSQLSIVRENCSENTCRYSCCVVTILSSINCTNFCTLKINTNWKKKKHLLLRYTCTLYTRVCSESRRELCEHWFIRCFWSYTDIPCVPCWVLIWDWLGWTRLNYLQIFVQARMINS